jgi:hypothetical protein
VVFGCVFAALYSAPQKHNQTPQTLPSLSSYKNSYKIAVKPAYNDFIGSRFKEVL